jgi:citrate lyase subunit beta-like protein
MRCIRSAKRFDSTVPGSDERKLHKSISVAADCIVYDLEDSVAASKKGSARQMIMDALEASEHGKAEKAVRINAVGSGKAILDHELWLLFPV